MAERMDGYAEREPRLRSQWIAMASHWRSLAVRAGWQDQHAASAF